MSQIRVLLADDHPVVRRGIGAVLALDERIQVIADVGDTDRAVELAADADVVLMDLQFGPDTGAGPGAGIGTELGGISATRRITSTTSAKVLVLTTYDAEADVLAAIEAGAAGYLLKSADPEELIDAVLRTHAGQSVLAPTVAGRLVRRATRPDVALTARELEVLSLVAGGRSNAQIAADLFLSRATVKTHLAHIFSKLDVDSRTAAVAAAAQRGLLRGV